MFNLLYTIKRHGETAFVSAPCKTFGKKMIFSACDHNAASVEKNVLHLQGVS